MSLKLLKNTSLQDLYLEEDQTIWFLVWILKHSSPCDRYISQMILESPFQVIQYIDSIGYPRQYIRKNWQLHGLARGWHQNSQIWYEHHFKNGQEHGLNRGWCDTGQLNYESHWKNGQKDGPERGWDEDGQLFYEENWNNGVRIK